MSQYSAKLLFQWLPVRKGTLRKRVVCEQKIITFAAESPELALQRAKEIAAAEEYVEQKSDGEVRYEFLGLLELKDITTSFDDGEVWSEIIEMVEPKKRIERIIPAEETLDALRKQSPSGRGRLKYY